MFSRKLFRFRLITLLGLMTVVALAFGSLWGYHHWKLNEYDRLIHDRVKLKDAVFDSNWRESIVTGKATIEKPWQAVIVVSQIGEDEFQIGKNKAPLNQLSELLRALRMRARRVGIPSVAYATLNMDAKAKGDVAKEAAKVSLADYGVSNTVPW